MQTDLADLFTLSNAQTQLHQEWSGRVQTMQAIYDRVWMEQDSAELRVRFHSAERGGPLTESFQALLPETDGGINISGTECEPLFMILQFGELVTMVEGCNRLFVT